MMNTFVHVHSSSKYNRSPASLQAAVTSYIEDHEASLITFTEVEHENREAVLRAQPGFSAVTGDLSDRNDAGIMYRDDVFTLVKDWNHEIADVSYRRFSRGRKRLTPKVAATSAVLEHTETGMRFLVTVAHMPSSVQGKTNFRANWDKVATWNSSLDGWRKFWNAKAKHHGVSGVLLVADWNMDYKKSWVRAFFKVKIPSFNSTWDANSLPKHGTHGARLIDISFVRGRLALVGEPKVLAHNESSDHSPYREVLAVLA